MGTSKRRSSVETGQFKLRGDLTAIQRSRGHSSRWIVKDPIALKHFEFTDDEYFLLRQFDGESSLEEVKQRFDRNFAPQTVSLNAIYTFLTDAHRNNLVTVDSCGQADALLQRAREAQNQKLLSAPLSVLGARFSFGDAQPILDWLRPLGQIIFHPVFVLAWLGVSLVGLLLFAMRATQVVALAPGLDAFFSVQNLWALTFLWMFIKLAHELGHGLACRKFGAECHEFGIQFLVFFPFAYCNVSDAWMLDSRWRRIVVSAAGMYVELILATFAVFLWYFSQPGFFHSLMFNLIVLCTVNTLLFNGNPLLRFDGYYILSDYWDVPNLHAQAKQALLRPFERLLLRTAQNEQRRDGSYLGLFTFGVMALVYRVFTVAMISWMLYHVLSPYKLQVLAYQLIVLLVLGLMLPILVPILKWLRTPLMWRFAYKWRLLCFLLLLGSGALVVLSSPWEYCLKAPVVLRPQDAKYVYAKVPGTLVSAVSSGQFVRAGEEIVRVRNFDLEKRVLEYRGRVHALKLQLENLEVQVVQNPELSAEIGATHAALQQATEQLASATEEQGSQLVLAPQDGVVLDPPLKLSETREDELETWTGSPLFDRNANCHIEAGDLLCLVGLAGKNEAMLLLDQPDLGLIRIGADVKLRLEHLPNRPIEGKIVEIARKPVETIPPALVAYQAVAPPAADRSGANPSENYFLARVHLSQQPQLARPRSTGWAKVVVSDQTLGRRLIRALQQVFYFEL